MNKRLTGKALSKLAQYSAGYRKGQRDKALPKQDFLPFAVYTQGDSYINGYRAAVMPSPSLYTLG